VTPLLSLVGYSKDWLPEPGSYLICARSRNLLGSVLDV